jgi:hypothetical protein
MSFRVTVLVNLHLSLGVTFHIDDVNILGQLDTSVGSDGRSLNGDSVGIVEESVGHSGFPP